MVVDTSNAEEMRPLRRMRGNIVCNPITNVKIWKECKADESEMRNIINGMYR